MAEKLAMVVLGGAPECSGELRGGREDLAMNEASEGNVPISLAAHVQSISLVEPSASFDATPFEGVLRGNVSISGYWDGEWPKSVERRRVVLSDEFVVFGLPLWTWRREFEGEVSCSSGGVFDVTPVTPVTERRAEPWRRALFHALRPVWRLVDSVRHARGES